MIFHELKDIVMIYSSGQNGKPDYSWDKAQIKVWNPAQQREMELIFSGSTRGGDENTPSEYRALHFNVDYKEDRTTNVITSFEETLRQIFPNIEDHTVHEYTNRFIETLAKNRLA